MCDTWFRFGVFAGLIIAAFSFESSLCSHVNALLALICMCDSAQSTKLPL